MINCEWQSKHSCIPQRGKSGQRFIHLQYLIHLVHIIYIYIYEYVSIYTREKNIVLTIKISPSHHNYLYMCQYKFIVFVSGRPCTSVAELGLANENSSLPHVTASLLVIRHFLFQRQNSNFDLDLWICFCYVRPDT